MNIDFFVLKFVRIVLKFESNIDVNNFDQIRKLNYIIHVVLRELIFYLFAIFCSLFIISFFLLIKCNIYDFYREEFSNENRKNSRSHEFSTFNDLSFNDLNFEINHFIFYFLQFVVCNKSFTKLRQHFQQIRKTNYC